MRGAARFHDIVVVNVVKVCHRWARLYNEIHVTVKGSQGDSKI